MEKEAQNEIKISIIWRGKTLELVEKAGSTIGELGIKLKELTNVAPDTMRLLLPRRRLSVPTSLLPFSDTHSELSLAEAGIAEGLSIRMMGIFMTEVEEVTRPVTKSDQRIAGFVEEERRTKQRIANGFDIPRRLPQGPYIFCDFRTLQLPGIELNPPAEKALAIMHRLASDPGIIAIMKEHRWRVGIMTELAPVGYVGISPKCILGLNKNHGEEISLRLRTDDLNGFRKYESIKKTLLHELAHMVHSEHDANFFALDKQLNQEAIALDWTKSRSQTLSGLRHEADVDELFSSHQSYSINKLGGNPLHSVVDARASAAAAALRRLENSPRHIASNIAQEGAKRNTSHASGSSTLSQTEDEPDPDDCSRVRVNKKYARIDLEQEFSEPDPDDRAMHDFRSQKPDVDEKMWEEPDPDDCQGHNVGRPKTISEPDPDDCHEGQNIGRHEMIGEPDHDDNQECHGVGRYQNFAEPDPDDSQEDHTVGRRYKTYFEPDPDDCQEGCNVGRPKNIAEPDPDDCQGGNVGRPKSIAEPDPDDNQEGHTVGRCKSISEPDPDDSQEGHTVRRYKTIAEPDPDDNQEGHHVGRCKTIAEPDPDDSQEGHAVGRFKAIAEPDPDDSQEGHAVGRFKAIAEPDPDDSQEGYTLRRYKTIAEPDPDDNQEGHTVGRCKTIAEPDPDDSQEGYAVGRFKAIAEPDPDDGQEGYTVCRYKTIAEPDPDDNQEGHNVGRCKTIAEPDPDESQEGHAVGRFKAIAEPDPDDSQEGYTVDGYTTFAEPDPDDCQEDDNIGAAKTMVEPDPDDCQENEIMAEPDPDASLSEQPDTVYVLSRQSSDVQIVGSSSVGSNLNYGNSVTEMPHSTPGSRLNQPVTELQHDILVSRLNKPVVSDFESMQLNLEHEDADLRRIQESTAATSVRLQDAIQKLKSQVPPVEIAPVIRTLFTILRNVMDHPNETKFRRLRKANPIFQRSISKYQAALEVLRAVGFSEDNTFNEIGIAETCLVLKRNDPGLLWLARSSLELCNA